MTGAAERRVVHVLERDRVEVSTLLVSLIRRNGQLAVGGARESDVLVLVSVVAQRWVQCSQGSGSPVRCLVVGGVLPAFLRVRLWVGQPICPVHRQVIGSFE